MWRSSLLINDLVLYAIIYAISMASILPKAASSVLKDVLVCSSRCRRVALRRRFHFQNVLMDIPLSRKSLTTTIGTSMKAPYSSSSLASLSKTIDKVGPRSKRSETHRNGNAYFPEISDKAVAYWLLGSAASVFGIVIFGGLTRLTESGSVLLLQCHLR